LTSSIGALQRAAEEIIEAWDELPEGDESNSESIKSSCGTGAGIDGANGNGNQDSSYPHHPHPQPISADADTDAVPAGRSVIRVMKPGLRRVMT